jgi:hypothetical protein
MRKRPLWPLLPPAAVFAMMWFFITVAGDGKGGIADSRLECSVKALTGFNCPGCGGTRCAQNILSGDWLAALSYNPLLMSGFVVAMMFFSYLIIRITILGRTPPRLPEISASWIWLGLTGIVLFTILRNLSAYPFGLLAP